MRLQKFLVLISSQTVIGNPKVSRAFNRKIFITVSNFTTLNDEVDYKME